MSGNDARSDLFEVWVELPELVHTNTIIMTDEFGRSNVKPNATHTPGQDGQRLPTSALTVARQMNSRRNSGCQVQKDQLMYSLSCLTKRAAEAGLLCGV